NRLYDGFVDACIGILRTQGLVEMFTHQSSILEDPAGHGHWYFGRGAKQATGYGNGTAGQFRSGLGQDVPGGRIARICGGKHCGSKAAKLGGGMGVAVATSSSKLSGLHVFKIGLSRGDLPFSSSVCIVAPASARPTP